MKTRLLLAALFTLTVGAFSAQAAQESGAENENLAVTAEGVITATATVTAINQEARELTLMGEDGEAFVLAVGDEVKNLAQINVGDELEVGYYEAVSVEVLDPNNAEPRASSTAAVDTAEPGEKPGAAAMSEVSVVTTVKGIDKAAETITLAGPEGNSRTVKVRNPDNLDKVAVGDQIQITVTRAVAVKVSAVAGD